MSITINYAPVSVVIPCYKAYPFLERAVNSVLSQTVLPKELVLIDDASSDNGLTKTLIEKLKLKIFKKNLKISVLTIFLTKNVGPGSARNIGWDSATQPWLTFLDADDAWHSSKIELQLSWMYKNPQVDLTCHKSVIYDRYPQYHPNTINSFELKLRHMLFKNKIETRTVMIKRHLPNRFINGERFSEDYRLWLDLIADKKRVVLLNIYMASIYRPEYSNGGQSSMLWNMERSELNIYLNLFYRSKISLFNLILCLIFSVAKFVLRVLRSALSSYLSIK